MFYFKTIFITITIVIILFCCNFCFSSPYRYEDIIADYAEKYNVDPSLIFAVCQVESGFDPNAVSSAGAIGLMQILPSTGAWLAEILQIEYRDELLYDPTFNIRIGTYYLAYLYTRFQEDWMVYAAYNAGENRVAEWLEEGVDKESIPFSETKNYVFKIERARKRFQRKNSAAFY